MVIIIDKRLPYPAKVRLASYGNVIEFETSGITYDAISGHPDIFFCLTAGGLVVAPNVPAQYLSLLDRYGISFVRGVTDVKRKYPGTAGYNAVAFGPTIIHNSRLTDPAIPALLNNISGEAQVQYFDVKQGYTRCNLLPLDEKHFLTSDKGIEKVMKAAGFDILYVANDGIVLPGLNHGFFGGCCGFWQNTLFISGSLSTIPDGRKVKEYTDGLGIEIVELCDGPLFDAGGILFVG